MKIQRIFNKLAFQTPISISLLISFVGLYLCAFLGNIWILSVSAVIACAVAVGGHLWSRKSFSVQDRFAVKLVLGALGTVSVSLICFSVRRLAESGFDASVAAMLVCAVLFGALFGFELVFFALTVPKLYEKGASKRSWRSILPLLIVCGIALVLSLENFNSWMRWDSYDYYYYFQNLSYSGLTVMDNLRPANHAAYGASLMYLLLDGVLGDARITLLAINILMLLAGTCAVWGILDAHYPHWSPVSRACCVSVYTFSPFLLGLNWSVCLEAYLMFGLVLYFWGRARNIPLVQTAAALLICFSKEIGAVLLAAIVASHLIMNLLLGRKDGRSFVSKLELQLSLPILGYGILWLCDFLLNSWVSSNSLKIETVEEDMPFNAFGINSVYMEDRLGTLLFTNFTWLLILTVAVGFIVGAIRRKHAVGVQRREFLVEVIIGAIASLIPLFFFITYNHIRYAGPTVVLLILLLPEALDRAFVSCRWRALMCGALAALSLVQCYVTIDPLMRCVCGELDKGKGTIAFATNDILVDGDTGNSISVDSQYNREILYFDFALNALLQDLEYDSDTVLIVSGEYYELAIGERVKSEYLLMGFGYGHMEKPRYVAWDADRGVRYLTDITDDNCLNIRYSSDSHVVRQAIEEYDRCIYISMPFRDQRRQYNLFSRFKANEILNESYYGWQFSAYELTEYKSVK